MNIPWSKPNIQGHEERYIVEALRSSWISGGAFVERFEKDFCQAIGAERGVAVSNGTTALQLAYKILDLQPGDEVIVPGFCFAAPVNMLIDIGVRPIYVDVDPQDWCLDARLVEEALTPKTKGVVAVHSYGAMSDMKMLSEIVEKHGLFLVEDCAEACFSKYEGRDAGTWGDIGTYSFHATKTITTGEGGFVVFKDQKVMDRAALLRSHGMRGSKKYWHEVIGYNYRLTNFQCAMGVAQLERHKVFTERRAALYERYFKHLQSFKDLSLQQFPEAMSPVVWALAFSIEGGKYQGQRDLLLKNLAENGIECRNGFYSFDQMEIYNAPRLTHSRHLSDHVLSLPFYPDLKDQEVDFIAETLAKLGVQ